MSELTCRQARDLATDAIDQSMPPGTLEDLRRHLAGCQTCPGLHRSLLLVVAALAELRRE